MSDCLYVIIITGPPGAGKTYLGRTLSRTLQLPFINKDDIKDILFTNLGWSDRQWSMKLGQASFEILFHSLESLLKVCQSVILETAFIPAYHTERFLQLRTRYDYTPLQIVCKAAASVLYQRFIDRAVSLERHPGHVDQLTSFSQFEIMFQERAYGALDIGGTILKVDTTEFASVDCDGLLTAVAEITGQQPW